MRGCVDGVALPLQRFHRRGAAADPNKRPPGPNHCRKRGRDCVDRAVTQMASKRRACPGETRRRARCARCGQAECRSGAHARRRRGRRGSSRQTTSRARRPKQAVRNPLPVPISSTASPARGSEGLQRAAFEYGLPACARRAPRGSSHVGIGRARWLRVDEGVARNRDEHVEYARVEHVPRTNLLFDHGFAGFGVIEAGGHRGVAAAAARFGRGGKFGDQGVDGDAGSVAVPAHRDRVPEVSGPEVTGFAVVGHAASPVSAWRRRAGTCPPTPPGARAPHRDRRFRRSPSPVARARRP